MNGLRKFGIALSLILFSLSLLLIAVSNSAVKTVGDSTKVKLWLRSSGFYSAINQSIKSEQKTVATSQGSISSLQPEIQNALSVALSTEFLETNGERVIDGLYGWLEGNSKEPVFSIDLTGVKIVLAQKIGDYATSRYNSLPVCSRYNLPDMSDVFAITCKVPGYDISPIIQKLVTEIQGNKDFFPSNSITSDNLNDIFGQSQGQSEAINFDELAQIPVWYQRVKLINTLLFFAVIIFGALAILLSANKINGLKRVAKTTLFVGISLLITALLTLFASEKIKMLDFKAESFDIVQDSVQKFTALLVKDIGKINLYFAIIYIIFGASILVYFGIKNKQNIKSSDDKPEDSKDTDSTKTEIKKD